MLVPAKRVRNPEGHTPPYQQSAPYMHETRHTAKVKYYTSIDAYETNGKLEVGAAPGQVEVPVKVEGAPLGHPQVVSALKIGSEDKISVSRSTLSRTKHLARPSAGALSFNNNTPI